MDSLDAQCLLVHLTAGHATAGPTEWSHAADGSLAGRFSGSSRTLTWPPGDVERLAEQWRALELLVPAPIADLVAGHRAYGELVESSGLPGPDRVVHDLVEREVTALYEGPRVAVVIGGEHAGRRAA